MSSTGFLYSHFALYARLLKLKRLILENTENAGAWSALGSMLYNGDCAAYTVPSEVSFQTSVMLEGSSMR